MRTVGKGKLRHGGIMANYKCNAACRHCLYACSPDRSGGYITKETAQRTCELLLEGGCYSTHIGGGEPFLDFDGLLALVEAMTDAGIGIDYIETNAFWAESDDAERRLRELLRVSVSASASANANANANTNTNASAGADTLCISVDPFHAEYIPAGHPLLLAEICRSAGFGYFLW